MDVFKQSIAGISTARNKGKKGSQGNPKVVRKERKKKGREEGRKREKQKEGGKRKSEKFSR